MSDEPRNDGERRALVRHLFDDHGVWLQAQELRRTSTQDLRNLDPCAASVPVRGEQG